LGSHKERVIGLGIVKLKSTLAQLNERLANDFGLCSLPQKWVYLQAEAFSGLKICTSKPMMLMCER
jgi:hypothetical protein